LADIGAGEEFNSEIAKCVKEKNAHEIRKIGEKYGVDSERTEDLCRFIGIYGAPESVIEQLRPLCKNEISVKALETLSNIAELFSGRQEAKNIRFDFSTVNDMHYYSGIVFGGFIDGIPESVLSGGQYGRLMEKMGRRADAVGFAIYLDLLSFLDGTREAFDVDVLVIADKGTPASVILELTDALTKDGKSVSVQSAIPEKLRYRELLRV
jgi:ATP phosphoribosyltransferase regulatory subunit